MFGRLVRASPWYTVKIYTRKGDCGRTGLRGGARVEKTDLRVEACGALDELNAALGVVVAQTELDALATIVRDLQDIVFALGAEIAAAGGQPPGSSSLPADVVQRLEATIDEYDAVLPELTAFILPGGTAAAANLHVARAVCRRAERAIVAVNARHSLPADVLACINRMSDLLFVLARWANRQADVEDITWRKPGR